MLEMTTEVDTSTLDFTEDEIKTAGLRPEGWYLFEIKNKKHQHVEGGISQRTGKPYDAFDVIKVTVIAKARGLYSDQGEYQGSEDLRYGFPMSVDLDNSNPGLARLKGLYKAATGRNLGAGNVESTVEEILGSQFWARIYHKEGNDGQTREEMDTWRFRSKDYGPAATITVRQQ